MAIVEVAERGVETGIFEEKLGILVPVAPVLIQTDYFPHPDVVRRRGIVYPECSAETWLTTSLDLPGEMADYYDGFAVVGSDGSATDLGIAIPKRELLVIMSEQQMFEELLPLWFFQGRLDEGQIFPIQRVEVRDGKRRLLDPEAELTGKGKVVEIKSIKLIKNKKDGLEVWMTGHEYVDSLITREFLKVGLFGSRINLEAEFQAREVSWVQESVFGKCEIVDHKKPIRKSYLVSGIEQRGGKLSWWKDPLPMSMLLYGKEPLLVGEGRVYNKYLARFSGW